MNISLPVNYTFLILEMISAGGFYLMRKNIAYPFTVKSKDLKTIKIQLKIHTFLFKIHSIVLSIFLRSFYNVVAKVSVIWLNYWRCFLRWCVGPRLKIGLRSLFMFSYLLLKLTRSTKRDHSKGIKIKIFIFLISITPGRLWAARSLEIYQST